MKMTPCPFKLEELTVRSYRHLCSPTATAFEKHPQAHIPRQQTAADGFEDQLHALIYYHLQEVYLRQGAFFIRFSTK